jgi:hypothetical protein
VIVHPKPAFSLPTLAPSPPTLPDGTPPRPPPSPVPYLLSDFVNSSRPRPASWRADAAAELRRVAPVWEELYAAVHAHGAIRAAGRRDGAGGASLPAAGRATAGRRAGAR